MWSIGYTQEYEDWFSVQKEEILFCFDKSRNAWLLIGRNKKGKNEKHFYNKLIDIAEKLIDKYPEILEGKDA
jgi:hypothetical protein